jgi:hypothetical protein
MSRRAVVVTGAGALGGTPVLGGEGVVDEAGVVAAEDGVAIAAADEAEPARGGLSPGSDLTTIHQALRPAA